MIQQETRVYESANRVRALSEVGVGVGSQEAVLNLGIDPGPTRIALHRRYSQHIGINT